MIWTWRIRRSWCLLIGWTFLLAFTLTALGIAWLNWRGAHDWARARARLAVAGADKTFDELVPPLPPEAVNFCAIPALRDLCAVTNQGPAADASAMTGNALAEMDPAFQMKDSTADLQAIGTFSLAPLELIRTYLYEARRLPVPPGTGNEGRDLLATLDATRPLMKEILAGVDRPQARFLTHWRGTRVSLKGMYGTSYGGIQVANAFILRARAAFAAGDGRQAVDCLRVVLHLEEAFSHEPGLMGCLVAAVLNGSVAEETFKLTEAHALTDAQLSLLLGDMERTDFARNLLRASRQDLAIQLELMELFEALPFWRRGIEWRAAYLGRRLPVAPLSWKPWLKQRAEDAFLALPGIWSGSKARLTDVMLDELILPLQSEGLKNLDPMPWALRRAVPACEPWHPPAGSALSAASHMVQDVAGAVGQRRSALMCLALERYKLAHGGYPATIQALVPEFLTELPRGMETDKRVSDFVRTNGGR